MKKPRGTGEPVQSAPNKKAWSITSNAMKFNDLRNNAGFWITVHCIDWSTLQAVQCIDWSTLQPVHCIDWSTLQPVQCGTTTVVTGTCNGRC